MAKIDCSNIFVFMEEWERRRKTEPTIWKNIENIMSIMSKVTDVEKRNIVDLLQKWSDEHPRQPRKEKFIQMCKENGFEKEIEKAITICENGNPICIGDCEYCETYWKEEVY